MKYRVMHVLGAVDGSATGVQSFIKNHIQVDDEEFEYMVAESNGDAHFPFNQYLDKIGIERIVFPELKISKVLEYFRECREFYKTNTIDILHVDNPITAFIHNYYAKKNGVPVRIYHNHNSQFSDTWVKSIRNRLLVFLALRNATHRISCGQLAGEKIFGNKSFQIIPNAIQIDTFKFSTMYREEIRKEFLIPEHQKVVGMVGMLDTRKNQNFLIEIAKELPNVIFLLVGEGPNRLKLEEKCTGLKNVIFTGNRNDVYKFYSAFDIFTFPSLFEGFPMVLVEAQCAGLNVIMNETIDVTTQIVDKLCTSMPLEKNKWKTYIEHTPVLANERPLGEELQRFNIVENFQQLKELYKKGLNDAK